MRKWVFGVKRIVLVGGDQRILDLYRYFTSHPEAGYFPLAVFLPSEHPNEGMSNIEVGSLDDVETFSIKNRIDEIFCSISGIENQRVQSLKQFADNYLIRFRIIPRESENGNSKLKIAQYNAIPVLAVRSEPLESIGNKLIKRIFDVLFSFFIILLIFPWLFLLVALIIKLTSSGPVIFRQLRSGKNNKQFICYKFRTMRVNQEADELQASKNDVRITPVGRLLRKTSLDELPQFFNVLIGNMSVVGPRPHMLKQTEEYSGKIDKFMVRHLVKPGITGWAQILGYRGETKDTLLMQKKVDLDVWYIENWSLWLDIRIVFYTIFKMIHGDENAG